MNSWSRSCKAFDPMEVKPLFDRYEALRFESSVEEWRQLSQDLLNMLVVKQGEVIALQRNAVQTYESRAFAASLRERAEAAFVEVQNLTRLRRKVQTILAEKRSALENDQGFVAIPARTRARSR